MCVCACVSVGQPSPSGRAYLIDQPHVCLTVPLGIIWPSSLICPLSLSIHSSFSSFHSIPTSLCSINFLIVLPCIASLWLSPSNLAFCVSASLLFLSLSINLVCLGWMEGEGGRTEAEDGLLNERERCGYRTRWRMGIITNQRKIRDTHRYLGRLSHILWKSNET